jgi:hypothetical protein
VYAKLTASSALCAMIATTIPVSGGTRRPGRELMSPKVGRGELTPPVPPDTDCGPSPKRPRELVERRVHESDRHLRTRVLNRKTQVTVVGDHHSRINATGEDVNQQM